MPTDYEKKAEAGNIATILCDVEDPHSNLCMLWNKKGEHIRDFDEKYRYLEIEKNFVVEGMDLNLRAMKGMSRSLRIRFKEGVSCTAFRRIGQHMIENKLVCKS